MIEKGDAIKYSIVGLILAGLIGTLFLFQGGPTGFAVYTDIGGGQTVLTLQTPDIDNLDDVYVDKLSANKNYGDKDYLKVQKSTWQRGYLKFNISAIPINQIIDNASLCMFLDNDQGSQTISINHVYNDSWCEGDGGIDSSPSCEITWNTQPCGTDDENIIGDCNASVEDILITNTDLDGTFQCFNIINMLTNDYDSEDELISMVLWTIDTGSADTFASKEDTNSSRWPYLNITYHTANTAPSLVLVNPQDGASYGYNISIALDFIVSDADSNLDSCWYNINNGANVSLASCANITFDIAEGSHDLNIYANDSLGEEVSDSASFSVAVGAPSIVLHYPIDVYFNNGLGIEFNYTPTDVDLDSCWLLGNFIGVYDINQTDDSVTSGAVNTFTLNLDDGTYLWNIGCNDSAGNSAINGNKTFYVDSVAPVLSISEPIGSKTSRTISASWSVSDSSPISCIYNVYQGASLEIVNTSVTCSDNSVSFDVSSDADFIFNLHVSDSAGNSNNESSSFSVDTSTPASPPSIGGGSSGGGGGYYTNNTIKLTLQTSDLGDIIAYEGEPQMLSLNVKNTGGRFFNKCRLVGKGEIESWIFSNQIEGIAPGQNIDFKLDLNIPEETVSGDYKGELEIKCDEGSYVQDISISIPGLNMININQIIQEKNLVKINYNFDNSYVIGGMVSVDIWIEDSEGYEIERIQDVFDINKDGLIERDVEIEFSGAGIYYVYFALSDDLENFVKESVVLGEIGGTGLVVLDNLKGKMSVYIAFLLLIGVGVFLIWRRHGKTKSSKHHWLIRKKK